MGMSDDIRDGLEDAFNEWDDRAQASGPSPIAQGAGPHAPALSSRTTTRRDPLTTSRLAQATRRPAIAQTLEEAILALTNGLAELLPA
jgi:hypothetical protein